jgi:chromosome segregation ATPase
LSGELEAQKGLLTAATAEVISTRNEALNAQATLKARLNEASTQIERLRVEAAQSKSHDQFLRAEGARLSNELENNKALLAKAVAELHQLRNGASDANAELQTRLKETTAQLEMARASALRAKAQEVEREDHIQKNLARLLEEVEAHNALASEAGEEMARLRKQTSAREEELRAEFVRLATEREAIRKATEEAAAQVARMQAELLHTKSQQAERNEQTKAETARIARERDAVRKELAGVRALLADMTAELDQTRAEAVWAGERAAERQDHLRALLVASPHISSSPESPEEAILSVLQEELNALRETLAAVRYMRDDTEVELQALVEPQLEISES